MIWAGGRSADRYRSRAGRTRCPRARSSSVSRSARSTWLTTPSRRCVFTGSRHDAASNERRGERTLRAAGAGSARLNGRLSRPRGLPRDPFARPAATPLIAALLSHAEIGRIRSVARASETDSAPELATWARQTRPIHPIQLYKAVRQFFAKATGAALHEDSPHAGVFSAASPQWLRHTFVLHALANGMGLKARGILTVTIRSTPYRSMRLRSLVVSTGRLRPSSDWRRTNDYS